MTTRAKRQAYAEAALFGGTWAVQVLLSRRGSRPSTRSAFEQHSVRTSTSITEGSGRGCPRRMRSG